MKNFKKITVGIMVVLILTATSITVFASTTYKTPADAVAGITGMTDEAVMEKRQSGKSYGEIAAEANMLDEFKQAIRDIKENLLNSQVETGTLTQEQADAQLSALDQQQSLCDGTGLNSSCNLGPCGTQNSSQGRGHGQGRGRGQGLGAGQCGGQRQGMRMCQ